MLLTEHRAKQHQKAGALQLWQWNALNIHKFAREYVCGCVCGCVCVSIFGCMYKTLSALTCISCCCFVRPLVQESERAYSFSSCPTFRLSVSLSVSFPQVWSVLIFSEQILINCTVRPLALGESDNNLIVSSWTSIVQSVNTLSLALFLTLFLSNVRKQMFNCSSAAVARLRCY